MEDKSTCLMNSLACTKVDMIIIDTLGSSILFKPIINGCLKACRTSAQKRYGIYQTEFFRGYLIGVVGIGFSPASRKEGPFSRFMRKLLENLFVQEGRILWS
jgi:hypothetical protein